MQDLSLAKLDEVRLALEKATTVQEVKHVRDMAIAAEVYAQQQKLGKEIQHQMIEYVQRAERKLGEMLKAAKDAGQITHDHHPDRAVVPNKNNGKTTLSAAGIDRKLSSRAQKLAAIPEADFEKAIKEGKSTRAMVNEERKAPKEHDAAPLVIGLYDKGLTNAQISKQTAVPQRQVRHIVDEEKIRRDAQSKIPKEVALAMSAQQRLDLAIKQHLRKLEQEFAVKVNEAARRYLDITSDELRKEQAEAKRVMESRKGIMDKATYKKILACLHPDWVVDPKQKARYETAFREFTQLEKLLLSEKDSPTTFVNIPKTAAEWEELRRKTTAERKAKRTTIKKS